MQWAACIVLGGMLWIQFTVTGTISQSLSSVCMCTQLVSMDRSIYSSLNKPMLHKQVYNSK